MQRLFCLLGLVFLLPSCQTFELPKLGDAFDIKERTSAPALPAGTSDNNTLTRLNLQVDEQRVRTSVSTGGNTLTDAMLHDNDILAAELAVIEAQRGVSILQSALAWQTDFSAQGGTKSLKDSDEGVFGTASATKLLMDNGETQNQINAAVKQVEVAYTRYEIELNEFLFEVLSDIENYNTAAELMNFDYLNFATAQTIFKKLEKMNIAGQIDSTTMLRAQQNLDSLEVAYSKSKLNYERADAKLALAFGVDTRRIDTDISVFTAWNDVNPIPSNGSLSIKLIDEELKAAEFEFLAMKAKSWGTVSVQGRLDIPASNITDDSDASVGLFYRKTLGDGGRLAGEIQAIEDRISALKQRRLATQRDISLQSSLIEKTISRNKEIITLTEKMLDDAALNVNQLENQLQIGLSDITSVLEANLKVFSLQTELLNLRSQERLANLELHRLRSQLLKLGNINAPLSKPVVDQIAKN